MASASFSFASASLPWPAFIAAWAALKGVANSGRTALAADAALAGAAAASAANAGDAPKAARPALRVSARAALRVLVFMGSFQEQLRRGRRAGATHTGGAPMCRKENRVLSP